MVKFDVLKYNQAYMSWLGLHSYRVTEPINEFFPSIGSCYMVPLIGVAFVTSTVFVFKHYDTDVMASVGALKLFFSAFQCGGMFLGFGSKMIQVKALHLELQRLVDEGIVNCIICSSFCFVYWNFDLSKFSLFVTGIEMRLPYFHYACTKKKLKTTVN